MKRWFKMATETPHYNRFEIARIIGARAFQISMGAPPLLKTKEFDPLKIAREEYNKDAIPIMVVKA